MIVFLSSMLHGNHDCTQLPVVIVGRAGGQLQTGRMLDYLGKPNRKMCSLYLSLMDKMGVHARHLRRLDRKVGRGLRASVGANRRRLGGRGMSLPTPEPSRLHRLLHIEPGHAPAYLYSRRNRCTGIDALNLAVVTALLGGFLLFSLLPAAGAMLIALVIGFEVFIAAPFGKCERKARARIRRSAAGAGP